MLPKRAPYMFGTMALITSVKLTGAEMRFVEGHVCTSAFGGAGGHA
ncbi:MAG: hypothetical protein KBC96_00610 [Armatimonadetes bacterium]|nr:hypothetical protein [Armatimonadota bacterium]